MSSDARTFSETRSRADAGLRSCKLSVKLENAAEECSAERDTLGYVICSL